MAQPSLLKGSGRHILLSTSQDEAIMTVAGMFASVQHCQANLINSHLHSLGEHSLMSAQL